MRGKALSYVEGESTFLWCGGKHFLMVRGKPLSYSEGVCTLIMV